MVLTRRLVFLTPSSGRLFDQIKPGFICYLERCKHHEISTSMRGRAGVANSHSASAANIPIIRHLSSQSIHDCDFNRHVNFRQSLMVHARRCCPYGVCRNRKIHTERPRHIIGYEAQKVSEITQDGLGRVSYRLRATLGPSPDRVPMLLFLTARCAASMSAQCVLPYLRRVHSVAIATMRVCLSIFVHLPRNHNLCTG